MIRRDELDEVDGLCLELALRIREAVLPALGSHAARTHTGVAHGGDVTFGIDELAEGELAAFAEAAPLPLAVVSEDRGLVADPAAEWLLVIDPVDGTRPALGGFEAACVSIAAARAGAEPTMGDVGVAVGAELNTGPRFSRGPVLPMTDAWGRPLGAVPLTAPIISCLAAGNERLHEALLAEIDRAFVG